MAAVTLLGSASFATTNNSDFSVTATPAADDLIIVIGGFTGNTATPTVTDNNSGGGGTYTLVNSALKAASADKFYMFVRDAKVTSATSTVFTIARSGGTTGGGLAVLKVTGMSRAGSNAIRSSGKQDNIASGTPAPALTGGAALTTNAMVGGIFNATNPGGTTQPASYTRNVNVGYNTPTTGLTTVSRDSGETNTTITWGGASASAFGSLIAELDTSAPPITGTATPTLDALTSSGDGDVPAQGTSTSTLDTVTTTTDVDVLIQAVLSQTLDDATLSGTGTAGEAGTTGTLTSTLDALASTADGDVFIQGTTTSTLEAVALTSDADTPSQGSASVTLSALTVTSDVDTPIQGSSSATLSAVTTTSDADVLIQGTETSTLAALTLSGSGGEEQAITGTLSLALSSVTLVSSGLVESPVVVPQVVIPAATPQVNMRPIGSIKSPIRRVRPAYSSWTQRGYRF